MRYIIYQFFRITLFLSLWFVLFSKPQIISAQVSCLSGEGIDFIGSPPPPQVTVGTPITFSLQNVPAGTYDLQMTQATTNRITIHTFTVNQTGERVNITIDDPQAINTIGTLNLLLYSPSLTNNTCQLWDQTRIVADTTTACNISYTVTVNGQTYQNPSCIPFSSNLSVNVSNYTIGGVLVNGTDYIASLKDNYTYAREARVNFVNGSATTSFAPPGEAGRYLMAVVTSNAASLRGRPVPSNNVQCTTGYYEVRTACSEEELNNQVSSDAKFDSFNLCANMPTSSPDRQKCEVCVQKNPPEIYTALGCIPTTPAGFIEAFLRLAIGLAGGFALLRSLFGAFLLSTSAGDPKQVETAKETITSSIIGLIVVIFSIVILQIIGVEILKLPGL